MREPTIVCLCGSTRFKELFEQKNKEFTLAGYIVLTVGFFMHADSERVTIGMKERLDELHKRKIDLADQVYIINPDGYIGDSTRSEIEYAEKNGKNIHYLYPRDDQGGKK